MPMEIYTIISLVLAFAAFIGFINHRFIKIAPAIAIMAGMLLVSLLLLLGEALGFYHIPQQIAQIPNKLDFHELLMNCLISFLLFAGGLTVDPHFLYRYRWEILILAVCSTIVSALLIAYGIFHVLILFGFNISFIYCLLFGALISPTDPIAVLALCKEVGAPKQLEIILAGESLFNDGVGIILFSTFYVLIIQGGDISGHKVVSMFIRSALGGIGYGLILGALIRYLIMSVTDHRIAILITLALTTAGYTFAQAINISGPLAIVVAGIYIGTIRHSTRHNTNIMKEIETFWDVMDEVLNALLFALLGLEVLLTHFDKHILFVSIATIVIVLMARYLTVLIPFTILKIWRNYSTYIIWILTWGGMRGALAISLALILPMGDARNLLLCMTYAVVVFAIIVQGGTVKSLVKKSKVNSEIK